MSNMARLKSHPDTKLVLETHPIERMRERPHASQDSVKNQREVGGLR